jgi:hypothetical protein
MLRPIVAPQPERTSIETPMLAITFKAALLRRLFDRAFPSISPLGMEITWRTRFVNRSRGVSPGTAGNVIFFCIVLYLAGAWRHAADISPWESLPVKSL